MAPLTYQIGRVRVHLISDGVFWTDGGARLRRGAARACGRRSSSRMRCNRIPMDLRSLLIESSEGLILVDTGHGHKLTPEAPRAIGPDRRPALLDRPGRTGVSPPRMCGTVINTHLHADHCGGNTALGPDGQL